MKRWDSHSLSNRVVVLSERPARVVADIEVPEHDESSDEVRELRRRILSLLGRSTGHETDLTCDPARGARSSADSPVAWTQERSVPC